MLNFVIRVGIEFYCNFVLWRTFVFADYDKCNKELYYLFLSGHSKNGWKLQRAPWLIAGVYFKYYPENGISDFLCYREHVRSYLELCREPDAQNTAST